MEFSFDENYKTDNDILLEKNDIVTVRMIPFLRDSESFSISGEVNIPGEYPIYKQNFNLKDAFENIKFTNDANISQVFIEEIVLKFLSLLTIVFYLKMVIMLLCQNMIIQFLFREQYHKTQF